MSNLEMTTLLLNGLPYGWGNFVSRIYGKKEVTPLNNKWSLCNIEKTRFKAKMALDEMRKQKHM